MNNNTRMIGYGNAKLAKSVGVFNLPEGKTCPGATPLCSAICYAKNRRCIKGGVKDDVTRWREKNYELSLRPDFPKLFVTEARQDGTSSLRMHGAGDVYSQEYLDKISEIGSVLKIPILMYTRSFDLFDFSRVPKNIIVYRSYDSTSPTKPEGDRIAYMLSPDRWQEELKMLDGYFVCPTTIMHRKRIKQYCGTLCKRCWNGSPRIAFMPHGVGVYKFRKAATEELRP